MRERERLYVWRANVGAQQSWWIGRRCCLAKYMLAMMDPINEQTYSRMIPHAEGIMIVAVLLVACKAS